MQRLQRHLLAFVSALVIAGIPAAAAQPRVFEIDAAKLASLKSHGDPDLLKLAIAHAERALKVAPTSVMDKPQLPPSGDRHDWYSQAGYWWPDPAHPGGRYIRHDGVKNPETDAYPDEKNLNATLKAASALGFAYYLTGNEAYAEHAAKLLRVWFLAPATAMNPNLTYAQFIKGRNDGRAAGIVSARNMPMAIDAAGLLAGSRAWTPADDAGLKRWFGTYYDWLTTSAAGRREGGQPNNHGTWYEVQASAIALYIGKTDDARAILTAVRDQRIPAQIDAKGMQQYEMVRTKSFSYSAMNLHGLTVLATIAAPLGIDLYKAPQARGTGGILTAVEALMPYDPEHPWPYQQIEKNREDTVCPALYGAAGYTGDARYLAATQRFRCKQTPTDYVAASPHP